MASKYIQKFPVPESFPEILHDLAKEILRNQPDDIVEFSALYFKCLQENIVLDYKKRGKNIPCDFKPNVPTTSTKDAHNAGRKQITREDEQDHRDAVDRSNHINDAARVHVDTSSHNMKVIKEESEKELKEHKQDEEHKEQDKHKENEVVKKEEKKEENEVEKKEEKKDETNEKMEHKKGKDLHIEAHQNEGEETIEEKVLTTPGALKRISKNFVDILMNKVVVDANSGENQDEIEEEEGSEGEENQENEQNEENLENEEEHQHNEHTDENKEE